MTLKRAQTIIAIVTAIVGVLLSLVVSALSGSAAYTKAISAVDQRVDDSKLEAARTFATKDEYRALSQKLDRISEDTAEIKGFIRRARR